MKTFEIETAVARWRADLAASDGISNAAGEELEGHLHESMDALQQSGLSEEEAFLVAARRLGKLDSLDVEFSQVTAHTVWKRRAFWMLLGFIDITAIISLLGVLAGLGTWGAVAFSAPGSLAMWSTVSYCGALVLIVTAVVFTWKCVVAADPSVVVDWFKRSPILFSMAIVGLFGAVRVAGDVTRGIMTQTLSHQEFGLIARHGAVANIVVQAGVAIAIFAALVILSRALKSSSAQSVEN